jgi:hypothetical protein
MNENEVMMLSMAEYCLTADTIPRINEIMMMNTSDVIINSSVRGRRWPIMVNTGWREKKELPRFPCKASHSH